MQHVIRRSASQRSKSFPYPKGWPQQARTLPLMHLSLTTLLLMQGLRFEYSSLGTEIGEIIAVRGVMTESGGFQTRTIGFIRIVIYWVITGKAPTQERSCKTSTTGLSKLEEQLEADAPSHHYPPQTHPSMFLISTHYTRGENL